jgi:hypothetical protein
MSSKKIIVLGAWNTGTNLMSKILSNSNCVILSNDNENENVEFENDVWKHHPKYSAIETIAKDPNRIVVIVYRNVYSWLNSMQKAPYELNFKDLISIAQIKTKDIDMTFRHILHVYNHYYRNYINLLNHYPNVIFFDYQKIANQEIAFDYINFKLSKVNLTIKAKYKVIQQLSQPSKSHGIPVSNSFEALKKYNKTKLKMMDEVKKYKMENFIDNNIIEFFENDY